MRACMGAGMGVGVCFLSSLYDLIPVLDVLCTVSCQSEIPLGNLCLLCWVTGPRVTLWPKLQRTYLGSSLRQTCFLFRVFGYLKIFVGCSTRCPPASLLKDQAYVQVPRHISCCNMLLTPNCIPISMTRKLLD